MSSANANANANAPNTNAVPSADLEALLSPPVAALFATMNLGGAVEDDVTLLSALPYMPSGGGATTFYPTTITQAIESVGTSASANPHLIATAANPSGPDAIYKALTPLVTGGMLPASDSALIDYFYQAGKVVYTTLLIDEISAQNGQPVGAITGDTPMPNTHNPNGGGALSINSLLDLIKTEIERSLPWIDANTGSQVNEVTAFMKIAASKVQSTITLALPSVDQRNFLFGQQEQDALAQLGLGPWLALKFMLTFVTNPDSTFVDQIYARYAVMQAIRIAFTKLAEAYDPNVPEFYATGGQVATLDTWVAGVLPTMIPTLSTADFQQTIMDVTDGAARANAMSAKLAIANKSLGDRLEIAGNLEVSKEAQEKRLRQKRRAFYAWAAAYVVLLAVSAFLISTERLSAFFALSLATLSLMALAKICAWVYKKLVRAGYGSP